MTIEPILLISSCLSL